MRQRHDDELLAVREEDEMELSDTESPDAADSSSAPTAAKRAKTHHDNNNTG